MDEHIQPAGGDDDLSQLTRLFNRLLENNASLIRGTVGFARRGRAGRCHVKYAMDISEAETGLMKRDRRALGLSQLVRTVAGLFDLLAEDKRVAVSIDIAESVICNADPERLQQVLLLAKSFERWSLVPGSSRLNSTPMCVDNRLDEFQTQSQSVCHGLGTFLCADFNGSAGWRVLNRVVEQIDEGTLSAVRLADT